MQELPTMSSLSYASSTWDAEKAHRLIDPNFAAAQRLVGAAQFANQQAIKQAIQGAVQMSNTRIVKIFVADNNDNLPLESRILFSGDEKLTELTDQELFFEVPINELLTKHNAVRTKTQDKKQAEKFGRDIVLEPARIRDLKMVVVTVAQF